MQIRKGAKYMDTEQESIILKLYEQTENEISNSKDYAELLHKYNILNEKFHKGILPKEQEELTELLQYKTDMESIATRDYFIEGFNVATKLMIEAIYKKPNI